MIYNSNRFLNICFLSCHFLTRPPARWTTFWRLPQQAALIHQPNVLICESGTDLGHHHSQNIDANLSQFCASALTGSAARPPSAIQSPIKLKAALPMAPSLHLFQSISHHNWKLWWATTCLCRITNYHSTEFSADGTQCGLLETKEQYTENVLYTVSA